MITEAWVCHDPAKPRWTHTTAAQPLTTANTTHHDLPSLREKPTPTLILDNAEWQQARKPGRPAHSGFAEYVRQTLVSQQE
jgi:hypothetical protein